MIAQQQAHCVAVQQQSASMVLRSQSLFARCCRRPMHFSSCSSPRVGVSSSAVRQAASASRGPRHAVHAGAVAPWKVQHSAHGAAICRSAFHQQHSRLSETRAAGGVDGLYRNICSDTAPSASLIACMHACIDNPMSAMKGIVMCLVMRQCLCVDRPQLSHAVGPHTLWVGCSTLPN